MEYGETLHESLIRELEEEVSLKIQPQELLFVCESIDKNRHVLHVNFKSQTIGGTLKVNPDERLKNAKFFTADEIKNLYIRPNIRDILVDILGNKQLTTYYYGNLWH